MVAGTGTDENIPVRLSHVESEVSSLGSRLSQMVAQVASLDARSAAQSSLLEKMDRKLDQQQAWEQSREDGRRPNLLALGMGVLMLLGTVVTYSSLRLDPILRELDDAKVDRMANTELAQDNAKIATGNAARMDHLESDLDSIKARLLVTESNRFTKQDSQYLEEELRKEIERAEDRQELK